jgi:hypothetical protein
LHDMVVDYVELFHEKAEHAHRVEPPARKPVISDEGC